MSTRKCLPRAGWKILVKNPDLQKATQFVVLLERGKGDSVKEIAEYWGDATIEEIYNRVMGNSSASNEKTCHSERSEESLWARRLDSKDFSLCSK